MQGNLFLIRTDQIKLLKALKKEGVISEITPIVGDANKVKPEKKPGRRGRPPKE